MGRPVYWTPVCTGVTEGEKKGDGMENRKGHGMGKKKGHGKNNGRGSVGLYKVTTHLTAPSFRRKPESRGGEFGHRTWTPNLDPGLHRGDGRGKKGSRNGK